MAIWLPYKAKAHEKKNARKQQSPFPVLCRICGKPLRGNSDMCKSCRDFINYKKEQERKHRK